VPVKYHKPTLGKCEYGNSGGFHHTPATAIIRVTKKKLI